MIRGKILFKCTDCGKLFQGLDIEYCATSLSVPQECPKCGSLRTRPAGLTGILQTHTYKKIWESMNKK